MFDPMTRRDCFKLTIHYYPNAALAGVHPFEPGGYPMDENPAYYRSHTFHFAKPPSRKDFLAMCRQCLPWTHVWENSLLPLVDKNICEWPMLTFGRKRAETSIVDENGLKVGHMEVWRFDLVTAEGYDRSQINIDNNEIMSLVNRVAKDRRVDAEAVLLRNKHRIMERISLMDPDKVDTKDILRETLVKAGFLKARRKVPVNG